MTRQIPLPLPHNAAMGADDFMITSSNREAATWVTQWPNWPAHGLIVTGAPGSGKTHLLNLWLSSSGGRSVSKDDLKTYDAVTLCSFNPCLAFDDAEHYAGDKEAEEALFHLYNHIKSSGGFLMLTMSCGAGQAGFTLPDLRSRLLTLPAPGLGAPDDDLVYAMLVKQFHDRQLIPDSGVVAYLAARTGRDGASLRHLVDRLDHVSLASGRKISIMLARKFFESKDDPSQS